MLELTDSGTVALPLRVLRSAIDGASFVPLLEETYGLERPLDCRLAFRGNNDNYFVWAGP